MRLTQLATLALLCAPALAADYACAIVRSPTAVVESDRFTVTASYTAASTAKLHCELKNMQSVVLSGDVKEVKGEGEDTFALTAPSLDREPRIQVAIWLGENWQQAYAPIVHTPEIRIISQSEHRRQVEMEQSVPSELERLRYSRSDVGNVAIFDDDFPGLDRDLAADVARAIESTGASVTRLNAQDLCNTPLVTPERFDLLVLVSPERFPAEALETVRTFTDGGGDLMVLGGPAFAEPLWEYGGQWVGADSLRERLADLPGKGRVFDLATEDLAKWSTEANAASGSGIAVDGTAPGGGPAAHLAIRSLTGWCSFLSPEIASPPTIDDCVFLLRVKSEGRTGQLLIEARERDGSRWMAVVPLTGDWKPVAVLPRDFQYWHDSASPGRGGPGDSFHPTNLARLGLGLAFTHTPTVGGGDHDIWVSGIDVAPLEGEVRDLVRATDRVEPIGMEGVAPSYKLFPIGDCASLSPDPRQLLWAGGDLPVPSEVLGIHPRPQGTGIEKKRRWRFIPLLRAVHSDGRLAGFPAALVLNSNRSAVASFPIRDLGFFRSPEVLGSLAKLARRMLDGVYLYEGGSRYFAYRDGEQVRLGAKVAAYGRGSAACEARVAVTPEGSAEAAFAWAGPVDAGAPAETTWAPERLDARGYRVSVSLVRGGVEIDRLEHPITVWRPKDKPSFMTTAGGDFIVDEHKWYAHGVNYMPSSGIATEDGPYFEFWLDPQPYDPDIIEWDLAEVERIGFNMISVFIYYRSIDSHNLWDLIARCERHGLKVNLSLRPGTPMDFRWDEMRALIERQDLARCDTIFAYDLAWEPVFGPYDARSQWDPQWENWVVRKYGGIAGAEAEWGVPIPRRDGKVTGPSDAQVASDGEWRKLAIDYRRFVDDLVHEKYAEARRLVRSVDPNHLVGFRGNVTGDPTCGQGWLPYDFRALEGAVDIMEPEGYGRIGDWSQVKPGWFSCAYARAVAPDTPLMWAEFGYSIWDSANMRQSGDAAEFQGRFYRDFYEMVLRSGASGSVCWWFPGGFRYGENSDFGIINPDRTWRPVTRVIHEYADRIKAERDRPAPDVVIDIDRYRYANGIQGVYEQVRDAFWRAVDEGKTPGLKWVE